MTPPRLSRGHLIFGLGLVAIGLTLMFDALSSASMGQPSFFQKSYHEVEWAWGLFALAVAIVWVGGSIGWWIVRTILQWWFHQTRKDSNPR